MDAWSVWMRWVVKGISPSKYARVAPTTYFPLKPINPNYNKPCWLLFQVRLNPTQLRGHGRVSAQLAQFIPNDGHVDTELWPACQTLARVISLRSEGGKDAKPEIRYYISSAKLAPDALAAAVRRHWAIENDLHWRLDVTFREDACTVRRDNAPENLSIIHRIILNQLKLDTAHPKRSLRLRRKVAGWDDDERARVLGMVLI